MKDVVHNPGNLSDQVVSDDPAVALGPDEVLVIMAAAPSNPVDYLLAAGWYGGPPTVGQDLGVEGVGQVVQVGAEVDRALLGRRVIVSAGQEAEQWSPTLIVPWQSIVAVADALDVDDAERTPR